MQRQTAVEELWSEFGREEAGGAPIEGGETEASQATGSPPTVGSALHESLTSREMEVLRLLSQGLSYAEIGRRLFISHRTVDTHLRSIYGKLNVRSRHEAARSALDHGLE